MTTTLSPFVFFGASHVDRLGWASEPILSGRSTPGRFQERVGGAALNTASLLAACGCHITLHSILGEDAAADMVCEEVARRRVTLLAQSGEQTAQYTAILDHDGDLVAALADMAIYDGFSAPEASTSGWSVIDTNLPEQALETIAANAEQLCALGVSVAKIGKLQKLIANIDLLFANEGEALALAQGAITVEEALQQLSKQGLKSAVISAGQNPVWMLENGKITRQPVSQFSAIKDVTGAGDALAALTLFELSSGKSLCDAAITGIKASQLILSIDGPYRADIGQALGLAAPVVL
ncbi:PfkB family carbohydrate kinase [Pseudahrensia aquimaris]|uniref:PfkB family carbohydrate kinase n=1 Tax=Pseudahrensia aquimaris TaxID=744461 RepID=A0ABW3FHY3_9HYPH